MYFNSKILMNNLNRQVNYYIKNPKKLANKLKFII